MRLASSNKDGSGSVFESQSIQSMFSQHSFVTGHYPLHKTSVATVFLGTEKIDSNIKKISCIHFIKTIQEKIRAFQKRSVIQAEAEQEA